MSTKLSKKFWIALVIFSLMGQVAWVVENMYFNVFIYKIFNASPSDISLMVALSAVSATLTSIFIGALSDKIGKRKIFIVGGYILWGVSILAFSLVRLDVINAIFPMAVSASSIGISLVIILDCVMTFFGSSANDAAFNAWLTDSTDSSNRGSAEGVNAMMPLVAILAVFGGFMAFNLDKIESWTAIFIIIGVVVIVIGVLGIFLIKEPEIQAEKSNYFSNIIYGFLPSTIKQNKALYFHLALFIIFNISIQIFMPYLIIYYEVSLQMKDYVLIMAPAIIIASIVTALWGKVYDKKGFTFSCLISLIALVIGYVLLYVFTQKALVFIGSLFMMSGYLSGMAVFGAKIRDNTPEGKAGRMQGVRIVSQVLVPGVVGPYIGKLVLKNADTIVGGDGTVSFIPSSDIFLFALIVLAVIIPFIIISAKMKNPVLKRLTTDYKVEDVPFNEHPRPQFKRDSFINLNGEWAFKVIKDLKSVYDGKILVPFPPESYLSNVERVTKKGEILSYYKEFELSEQKGKTLLHFGAVDNACRVYINDEFVGEHVGGYLPFTFDISKFVKTGLNLIKVVVEDNLDITYPYGKQSKNRGGMWYTPISGIWQTVWIENVCDNYIKDIKITPSLDSVTFAFKGGENKKTVIIEDEEYEILGNEGSIKIKNPKLWTPKTPNLYHCKIICGQDVLESYFALRTIEIEGKTVKLNGKKYFFNGVLDQGYFPDGIYLPANYKGYEDDVLKMKELGFNMLRKHIKIEPMLFYYYCDKHGMAVFQDMVNNGKYSFLFDTVLPTIGFKKKRLVKTTQKQREVFIDTATKTVEHLYNCPSIVYYTIFNEGWGQHNSSAIYKLLKNLDGTRVWDTASGWFNDVQSDVQSEHVYFKKIDLKNTSNKPLCLSEFGGYSYKILEYSFNQTSTYGYKNCTGENFMKDMESLYLEQVIPNVKNGLFATVLTQLSDVEDETNGLLTYDRKVLKVDSEKMQNISKALFDEFYKN